jgi:hypothetical protein
MFCPMAVQWYHFQDDLIWPERKVDINSKDLQNKKEEREGQNL